MRSFRQRSFLSLLALHDVIDDDWLVHAVSFIFPYFCVYFHLFAQAKRLGRRRLLLLLLLFSFLRVSRRRRRRCYPPPRFREEELIHQSSKKFSPLDASSYSSVVKVCSFFDERFSIDDRVFFSNLSLHKKKQE